MKTFKLNLRIVFTPLTYNDNIKIQIKTKVVIKMNVYEMLKGNDYKSLAFFTVKELKKFAKQMGIQGFSKMRKNLLCMEIDGELRKKGMGKKW